MPDEIPPVPTPLFPAQSPAEPAPPAAIRPAESSIGEVERAIAQSVGAAQLGKLGDAMAVLAPALEGEPNHPEGNGLMGTLLCAVGRPDQAIPFLQRGATAAPMNARMVYQLGAALVMVGQAQRGMAAMARALQIEPGWVQAMLGLAGACQREGDYDQAAQLYRKALELSPQMPEALCGLAGVLILSGSPQEAVSLFRAADQAAPGNAEVLGRLLSALNYADDATPQESLDAHQRWGRSMMATAPASEAIQTDRDPERPLRIGFLSPDLYDHSCAYFLRPILQNRDRDRYQAFCYACAPRSDWMTQELRQACDGWREAVGLRENQLVDMIRADNIDILIELSGHTAAGPLAALRRRAAPVQATYLGYPNTTGLPTIDYRLVDSTTDPAGADAFHTEKLARLEGCFLCYSPMQGSPEPVAPPCLGTGNLAAAAASDFGAWLAPTAKAPVTFGSFNSIRKLSPATIRAWAAVLHAVPGSRMLIKTRGLETSIARNTILRRFAEHSIGPERLALHDMVPSKGEHLSWYAHVDVALDTFPYNGTTTTCEALWMGVPVVTLAGTMHAGRVGVSLLKAAGLSEFVGRTPDDFVRIAAGLASDPARLAAMRGAMRAQLASSPLLDAAGHARQFEGALREMWRGYCAKA